LRYGKLALFLSSLQGICVEPDFFTDVLRGMYERSLCSMLVHEVSEEMQSSVAIEGLMFVHHTCPSLLVLPDGLDRFPPRNLLSYN
jgi:hypothetical protein